MRALHPLALGFAALVLATSVAAQDKAASKPPAKKPGKQAKETAPTPPPLLTLSLADAEQLLAAAQALIGPYDCEFKQVLKVTRHQVEGYIDVSFANHTYTMKPVRSTTGALRLEQIGGPMLMVQIPAKSMLMDTAKGKRVVDACVHEVQAKEVSDPNSLDMNLPGQVSTANTMPTVKR